MRFALDESALVCDHVSPEEAAAAFEVVADNLSAVRGTNTVWRFVDVYDFPIHGEATIGTLLFGPEPPVVLDRDLRARLQIAIDRCADWNPDVPGADLDVTVGDRSFFAPTVAFAHERRRDERIGCIGAVALSGRDRALTVLRRNDERSVDFVGSGQGVLSALRAELAEDRLTADDYFTLARTAFPNLGFAEGLAQQVRRLDGGFEANQSELTRHLAALDDCGLAAFAGFPTPDVTIARMKSAANVEMSPESPQTRRNGAAWAARKIRYRGVDMYCDWHLKLTPQVNRVHFHPPRAGVSERFVIGIIHAHLPI